MKYGYDYDDFTTQIQSDEYEAWQNLSNWEEEDEEER